MEDIVITSSSNQQIKKIRELLTRSKARSESGLFIAEGIRMVAETPPQRLEKIYISESFRSNPPDMRGLVLQNPTVVKDSVFRAVSGTQHPQGIMAVVRQTSYDADEILQAEDPLIVFLENIQDPGNLGTIIRTAECAGVTGIIMSPGCADLYNPKTVRATMGSLYRMKLARAENFTGCLETAGRRGITVYAAHLEGSHSLYAEDFRGPSGILIGNEGNGLTAQAVQAAGRAIRIPMAGQAESLNASVAAAVIMYEAARQRIQS